MKYMENVIKQIPSLRNAGEIPNADDAGVIGSVECGDCDNTISITTLVNDNASQKFAFEHGLSFWIKYGNKRFLFDTGQTNVILRNAKLLRVDLTLTDGIIVSYGHYDHTGGLAYVLDVVPTTTIYLHPAAIKTKFSRRGTNIRDIGMPDLVKGE
jgi:7,8-dihydropterin-6-yl-methyl-4-(beta-D-ribofuranosyl)aminobenzene 5'-phosphate synthase